MGYKSAFEGIESIHPSQNRNRRPNLGKQCNFLMIFGNREFSKDSPSSLEWRSLSFYTDSNN
jgi:hypothetical protein